MQVLHAPEQLAPYFGCALVPTMGALHAGHGALMRRMSGRGMPVLATVFVNPTQFAPREDFAKYPRTLADDVKLAEECGADAVFAPTAETIYPFGLDAARAEAAAWPLPDVAHQPRLEDASRPTHFGGVCQVVARLFDLTQPAIAVFGEKDFQQLRVLEDMTAMARAADGRWGGLVIEAAPTVREHDGLAMSSRNRYLQPEQRDRALALVRALQHAAAATDPPSAERIMRTTLEAHGMTVDYAVVRHASTLLPVNSWNNPTRALIAARIGDVRLIDNMAMPIRGHLGEPAGQG